MQDLGAGPSEEVGPSYVSGASDEPLIGETIGRVFDAACRRHADALALIVPHQTVRWTYGELKARVDALACGLLALGLTPGDRVGIWAPNCAEWILTQFATAKLGLILVTINPAYRTSEVEYVLNKVGCRALVAAQSFKSSDYVAMLAELLPTLRPGAEGQPSRVRNLEFVLTLGAEERYGCLPLKAVMSAGAQSDAGPLESIGRALNFDDPVNVQFTSGTTGLPKGATLSHHNILNNGFFVGRSIGLGAGDKICTPVPLYHCFGMVMANLACLTHAACVVYPAEGFDALATLAAVAAEGCTALYGVPTMFIAMLNHPDFLRFDLSSLRTGIMAGSPCPIEVLRQVVDRMNMREVTSAYGMTETSPVSFQSRANDPLELRVATVGRIHPHLEAKVVDGDGRILPFGHKGELCTRGYSTMLGYWGEDEQTAATIDEVGWLHTGDLATLDAEGVCRIVGRLKDMVIRGGENIYPREIEEFFFTHDAVLDVQVVGVPDPQYGEELCAWLILKPDSATSADDLRLFAKDKISHQKVPRYLKIVSGFPTTATGKVQKFLIQRAAIAENDLRQRRLPEDNEKTVF